MKYIGRLLLYAIIFFLTLSVSYTAALRFVPVTITPLKIIKLFDNIADKGIMIDSRWRSLDNINMSMLRAVMASEDNNFLIHNGFDIEAIKKAIEYNSRHTKKKRGASTISQQTAKNVFCYPSRSWIRKGFETYYTALMEVMWSKQRVIEVYLNIIETHPNVYGVEAAAQRFFDKKAAQLNIYDATMIACVLPNPHRMNLERPSAYMNSRAARIRSLNRNLPPVDFENPIPPTASRKRR